MYKRGEKLIPISTGTGESTRRNVLHAAAARKDEEIKLRMTADPDLFAHDAKYRQNVIQHTSKRNSDTACRI